MMDGARVVTPTVPQGDAWECGVAALAILMGYYGCHIPLEELRRVTGVSRQGSNFLQMRDAARRYGLRARVFRKSPEHLAEAGFPCIVHMNFNHFVVVEGMRNGRVFLNDQGCGPHDISWDEFDEGFTGLVMTLEPGEETVLRRRPPARWLILCRQLLPARRALVAAALTSMVYGLAIAGFAWSLAARLDEAAGPGRDAISAASRLPRLGRKITPSPRYSGERVGVRGNAVKDFGSRIRQNSGVWRESPKSGDFGYDRTCRFLPASKSLTTLPLTPTLSPGYRGEGVIVRPPLTPPPSGPAFPAVTAAICETWRARRHSQRCPTRPPLREPAGLR